MPQKQSVALKVELDQLADEEEYESCVSELLRELRDAGVALELLPISHSKPSRAKDAGQLISVGGQVLVALASGGALVALINATQTWLLRSKGKEVTLELSDGTKLVIKEASEKQIDAVVRTFTKKQ